MPTFAKNKIHLALLAVFVVAFVGFTGHSARAEMVGLEEAMQPMTVGSADAPLVMHEYSSLTCPHCAAFHSETLPKIKKDYVDTGKVRIEFHDFPLGNLALGAQMIVRCSGPGRNVEFFNMLYDTQQEWGRSENPLGALITFARFYGMSADDVNACLANKPLRTAILENQKIAGDMYGIDSTPTFVIDGKVVPGNLPYEDFQDILDEALAAKGVE